MQQNNFKRIRRNKRKVEDKWPIIKARTFIKRLIAREAEVVDGQGTPISLDQLRRLIR